MATVIFDNEIVESHRLYPSCGSSLSQISERDYPQKEYFSKRIVVLDLDSYESEHAKGNKQKTVDAVIGVADFTKKRTNRRLQLMELRLGYESEENLSVNDLKEKVSCSLAIVGLDIPVEKVVLFVFREEVVHEAKRWIEENGRVCSGRKKWMAVSPMEFSKSVVFEEELPYIPENDYSEVRRVIRDKLTREDWNGYLDLLDYWGKRYFYYLQRYNLNEAGMIKNMIKECFDWGLDFKNKMNEEERFVFELLEGDLKGVLCGE